ncbi:MAG TPA: hypothetical protein VGH27_21125 [Streptosporangiaceae bacterium]
MTVNFLDLLTISNTTELNGTVDLADLEALYSPRAPATPPYVAIPRNPSWLQFEESSNDFSHGGETILTGGGAGLTAADPGSAGANVIAAIGQRLPSLAPQAQPNLVQATGDLSADGAVADLTSAQSELASLSANAHDAVGADEISQGSDEENGSFAQVFGDTHYAYTDGGADVIVTDSSNGSLLASDAYQVPDNPQYPWLVQELSANRSPVVVVVTSDPAYDPHPNGTNQFSDRWEAQMYLQLVQEYQQSHPATHVVMLYGQSAGFAEQILDPGGQQVSPGAGIPQLTFADLGTPADAPASQGGFYQFGLQHVTSQGDLQYTVEPVLSAINVSAPEPTLAAGATETVTATGTNVGGGITATTSLTVTG